MRLTIGIPNYNGGKNLYRAIKSCLHINLKPDDYEILVVDNNSTDNSLKLVNDLKCEMGNIRLIENDRNYGRVGNWNRVIEESEGNYIIFLFANDQINKKNNIGELIDLMEQQAVTLSKSNKINLSEKSILKVINQVLYVEDVIKRNFKLLSSLPFGPTQTLIFDLEYLKRNNLKFNINNEVTADHELGIDILKLSKNVKILKTNGFNILFDDTNKNRLHSKLSYYDMLSSEFDLIMKEENYKLISDNKEYIVRKYLTRINYIFLLNKISFGKMFPHLKQSDRERLYEFFSKRSLFGRRKIFFLNMFSFFDFHSFFGLFLFLKNKGNSI